MPECARCHRKVKPEQAVYSPFRKKHYCWPADWARCDKKFKAEQKKGEG